MIRLGRKVWRATEARQFTMFSASFSAGMTTSTVASRQSSIGVGVVIPALNEAENIVNAVGPEILAEFKKQDERRPGFSGWFDKIKRRR